MPAYPLTFPNITPSQIEFTQRVNNSIFTSPFTGRSQVYTYQAAQWWELNLKFPSLTSTKAQQLTGFLVGLNGTAGTFYFTIPPGFRLSGNVGVTVLADGNDVTVNSGTPTVGLYGVDNVTNRLCMFTGLTSIFPSLPSGNTTIVPSGGALFRLATSQMQFSVDEMMEYGITVPILEAL